MSENQGVEQKLPQGNTTVAGEAAKEAPIDQLLLDKLGAMRCIVNIDELLQTGIFLGAAAGEVIKAQKFLKELHAPIRKECEAHPDWLRATNPQAAKEMEKLQKAEEKRVKKAEKKGLFAKITGRAN